MEFDPFLSLLNISNNEGLRISICGVHFLAYEGDSHANLLSNNGKIDKWEDLISGSENSVKDATKKCEMVWSYITKFNDEKRVFELNSRIDEYLHIPKDKEVFDANHLTNAGDEIRNEIKLRYIDFLMTVYTQVRGSVVASKWKMVINDYIRLTSNREENECNIAISAGFAARGWAEVEGKTKMVNIISGCQDFIEGALCIDPEYSLTNRFYTFLWKIAKYGIIYHNKYN